MTTAPQSAPTAREIHQQAQGAHETAKEILGLMTGGAGGEEDPIQKILDLLESMAAKLDSIENRLPPRA